MEAVFLGLKHQQQQQKKKRKQSFVKESERKTFPRFTFGLHTLSSLRTFFTFSDINSNKKKLWLPESKKS